MKFCKHCKNNISCTAIPANLEHLRRFGLFHTISNPTDTIKIRVSHDHFGCSIFEPEFAKIWWQVMGKLF
jgi:hypothetical protein